MNDTKKKLAAAGIGALVLGAGSYLAFSGGAENVAPETTEKVAVQPEIIPAVPQATDSIRRRPGKVIAHQNGERPNRRPTASQGREHPTPPRRGSTRRGQKQIKTPLPPGA